MASMQDFAPGGRFYYSGQYDDPPPWKKKKSSLFWEDQLERQPDIRDDPASNLGFFGTNYSNWPAIIQRPVEWYKEQVLSGEARDERINKGIDKFVSNLGESMSEREARLEKEKMEAAAKKQRIVQEQRRMPTEVPSIPKIEEEEDLMDKYLKYMLMSSILGNTAGGEYAGTSSVSIGQARPWPTMTPMV
jgi:hypothetical protein